MADHTTADGILATRLISAEQTHDLRHAVLRPAAPRSDVDFAEDQDERAAHIGAYRGDDLIAIASVYPEARPGVAEGTEWRLRGMASTPAARGTGGGAAALAAIEAHVQGEGALRIWCNARTPAAGFYERAGWRIVSDVFDMPGIGPHVVMEKSFE